MNKSEKVKEARSEFIKDRIDNSEYRNKNVEISKLSRELFLSKRTIERDYKKNTDTTTD